MMKRLILIIWIVSAAPIFATTYYTDFNPWLTNDFCDGAIMEYRYRSYTNASGYSIHSSVTNTAGVLRMQSRYGGGAFQALIVSGQQSTNFVRVGENESGDITNKAYGLYNDVYVRMTYTLYNQSTTTNTVVYLAVRKKKSPYDYRTPHYIAVYDGRRLQVTDWTYSAGMTYREIAGCDVTMGNLTNRMELVMSAFGGDDNGGTNGTPVRLEAQLWENGVKIGIARGVDDAYNWVTGPEVAGSVFDPLGDYGNGTWTPAYGDWYPVATGLNSVSWNRGGRDILNYGWIVFGERNIDGGTFRGIDVSGFYVSDMPPKNVIGVGNKAVVIGNKIFGVSHW
jgi:hypothetical protein